MAALQPRTLAGTPHRGTASQIITTTQEFRNSLETLFPGRVVEVVYNGYSEKDGPRAEPVAMAKFTVCHAGLLYAQRRPDLLFQALRNLVAKGDIDPQRVAVEFYGKVPPEFPGWVKEHGLETMVKAGGTLPRPDILGKQRRSNLLLLIQTGDGALPSKLFEYMGTGIPILALVDAQREAADILQRTGAGSVCTTVAETETALLQAYRHWLATGLNQVLPANAETAIFNRQEQSRRLYEILKLKA
jgi:glycosyltransferase involved in cell wall biosynthesis